MSFKTVRYITIFLYTCSYVTTQAQQDKIYLNNGSFILGNIQAVRNDSVNVQVDDSHFWLNNANIYRIAVRSKVNPADLKILDALNKRRSRRAFKAIFQVALLTGGPSGDREPFPGVSGVGIYQFGRWLQLGAGIAYNSYADFRSVPVYLYYKGDLFIGKQGVFYYMGYGYGKVWERQKGTKNYESAQGGAILSAGAGYIFGYDSVQVIFSVGWIQQRMKSEGHLNYFYAGDYRTIISRSMNRIEFKLGIII